ncbi:zinc ribbon domain-containing protein [Levilactobacillus bambusae]|uniref:Zinc-ribbon domain-containing protein n=1 Tax=Levilactobacillus bambusae TaxID=2024736 RepID=A0A2V1MY70_9LACO|nr:zinc ribbon domain-containing protein [Levilactobacillus bambusae]PWF99722.1 hypothetical protein DCM90_06590 [Levilactobacillus bambusae]
MKFCPQCGSEVQAGQRFCNKCGYDLTPAPDTQTEASVDNVQAAESQEHPRNERTEQVKTYASNYWVWLKATWLTPGRFSQGENAYFGIISLGLSAVLMAGALLTASSHLMSYYMTLGNVSSSVFSTAMNALSLPDFIHPGFGGFMNVLLWVLAVFALYLAVGYGANRLNTNQVDKNFWQYTNRLASFTNGLLVINLILFLVSFTVSGQNSVQFFLIVLILSQLLFTVGHVLSMYHAEIETKISQLYVIVAAYVIIYAAMAVFISSTLKQWFNLLKMHYGNF